MKKINAKWNDAMFGIDETDGKLKLILNVTFDGKELPHQLQLIMAFQALASIALQTGMNEKQLFNQAFEIEHRGRFEEQ